MLFRQRLSWAIMLVSGILGRSCLVGCHMGFWRPYMFCSPVVCKHAVCFECYSACWEPYAPSPPSLSLVAVCIGQVYYNRVASISTDSVSVMVRCKVGVALRVAVDRSCMLRLRLILWLHPFLGWSFVVSLILDACGCLKVHRFSSNSLSFHLIDTCK